MGLKQEDAEIFFPYTMLFFWGGGDWLASVFFLVQKNSLDKNEFFGREFDAVSALTIYSTSFGAPRIPASLLSF